MHKTQKFLTILLPFIFISSLGISSCPGKVRQVQSGTPSGFDGVDYSPNHYPAGDARNGEDEANVYPELKQLKSAGFNTIRMYGEPGKTWIAVINAANQLNLKVVYQLALCETGTGPALNTCLSGGSFSTGLTNEITQLNGVIAQVTPAVFQKVVSLVLAGNEIYASSGNPTSGVGFESNITNLVDGVNSTKNTLTSNGLNIPVSISLQADVMVSGYDFHSGILDTNNKIYLDFKNTLMPIIFGIGINVYPFQWVVPVQNSVNSPSTDHSLAWYLNVFPIMYAGTPFFISETGWATEGNYINPPGCSPSNPPICNNTTGNLADAEIYMPSLYQFVESNPYNYPYFSNLHLLAFMAFDVPTKSGGNVNLTSEDHYGVFTDECELKGAMGRKLIPNTSYSNNPGCSVNNAIFTFVGGNITAQPPFVITYTHAGIAYTVNVPTADRNNQMLTPWPTITLSPSDSVTITSGTTGSQCTNHVVSINTSNHSGGTWASTTGSGTGNCSQVNWATGQLVYLPAVY